MRRAWAALLAVWSTLAIVAVLAWSHPPVATTTQATPVTVVVQGKNGKRHLGQVFVLPAGSASHSSTNSSPTTGSASRAPSAASVFVSNPSIATHVVTRTS